MEKALKLKIILLGPESTGKTIVVNFLSDVIENGTGEVRKTRGVRIVEFQVEDLPVNGKKVAVDIEMWDCSGDHRYQPCWPVFFHDAEGLILVFSKDTPQQKKDLEAIFTNALDTSEKLASNCALFYNNYDNDNDATPKSILPKVECVKINIEEKGEALRSIFYSFIGKIIGQRST